MELQEIFDKVVTHLRKQNAKSVDVHKDIAEAIGAATEEALALLIELQRVHDRSAVTKWESDLRRIAERFNLTMPVHPIAKIIIDDVNSYLSGAEFDHKDYCDAGTCPSCDESRDQDAQILAFLKNPPTTLFQAQLIKWGACLEGRVRVGSKSAREWWNTSTKSSDMRWILDVVCLLPEDEFFVRYADGEQRACNAIRAAYPFEKIRELTRDV